MKYLLSLGLFAAAAVALATLGAEAAELGSHGATTLTVHTALGTLGALTTELGSHGATTLTVETALGTLGALTVETVALVMALAVELVTLALTSLLEGVLYSLLLFLINFTILVGIEPVHELGAEVFLHGLLFIVINLAILVGVELGHELSLASLHSSLAILLGSGLRCGGNGSGGNGLRCRSRSGLRLSFLSEDRQSGYEGDDE